MKCTITELDMGIPSTTAANLEEQARQYRIITDIVLNNDNCPNMIIWGLKDNDSWRSASNPLLYDAGLGRKKAWYAVRSALRHRSLGQSDAIYSPSTIHHSPSTIHPFALDGRRVSMNSLRPGIYIKDGKKFVVK